MAEEKIRYTKYETARLIGSRALQISMGAPFMIKLSESDLEKIGFNPVEIAKIELENDVLPITVRKFTPKTIEPVVEEKKAQ